MIAFESVYQLLLSEELDNLIGGLRPSSPVIPPSPKGAISKLTGPITKYKEFLFVYYEMRLEEKIFA
jgi:hypothetical protein